MDLRDLRALLVQELSDGLKKYDHATDTFARTGDAEWLYTRHHFQGRLSGLAKAIELIDGADHA